MARTASATAKAPSSRPSMAARISVRPGLLDVVILNDSGSLKMLDEFVNLKSRDHFDDDNIICIQATTVSIKSKERDVTVSYFRR
jgi:diacylglycerol kinase family enzyme